MTYDLIQKVKEICPDAICDRCHGEGIKEGTDPENSAAFAAYCQSCNETGIEPGYEEEVETIKNQMI